MSAILAGAGWNCGRIDPVISFSNFFPLSANACVIKLAIQRFLGWVEHFRCMISPSTNVPKNNQQLVNSTTGKFANLLSQPGIRPNHRARLRFIGRFPSLSILRWQTALGWNDSLGMPTG